MTLRITLLVLASLTGIIVAPFIGPPLEGDAGRFILLSLRIPRVVMGVLVGATLSLVGAAYQTIFGNPLATPSTVGTMAGATLGALFAIVLGGSAVFGGMPTIVLSAFVGALVVTAIVTAIAASGRARTEDVLLAGIAVSLAASAIASGIQFSADARAAFASVQWSLGNLAQVQYGRVVIVLPFAVSCAAVLLSQTNALETLVTGEERAHSQGVNVPRARALILGAGALGVAACVACSGPIAFVGLIVPHIVRLSVGASQRVLLPLSAVLGGCFLVLCDTLARLVLPGRELPVGVLTAAIGAPALVWLIARRRS